MSPEFRKAALIAATLGLLVSLFLALRADGDEGATRTQTEQSTTRPEPSVEPLPSTTGTVADPTVTDPARSAPVAIRIDVPGDAVPEVRRFSFRRGRVVEIIVRAEFADEVHLHGYDLAAEVGPSSPGRIRFTADAAGRFEVELEGRRVQIADIEVRP